MSDLIDRQAAIDALRNLARDYFSVFDERYNVFLDTLCKADKAIRALPSVQPERKTGKWIVDALADNIYRCSECGIDAPVEPTGGTEYKSNYCQNCGADMRERRTE